MHDAKLQFTKEAHLQRFPQAVRGRQLECHLREAFRRGSERLDLDDVVDSGYHIVLPWKALFMVAELRPGEIYGILLLARKRDAEDGMVHHLGPEIGVILLPRDYPEIEVIHHHGDFFDQEKDT